MNPEDIVNKVLGALADPTRRQIVEMLSDGEARSVSEITGHFGMSRQAVTKHLAVLNEAGIVLSERRGRDRRNRLQPHGLDPLREWFSHYSKFWDSRLAALKQQVEQEAGIMTSVDKEIFIDAAPEVVWRHLEDPDLLAGWLMRNNFRAEPGTAFQFWKPPAGDWDGTISSRLVEFEPPRRMSFTWNANTIGTDTLVTIELAAREQGTLLRLLHTNWDHAIGDLERHHQSHSAGWDDHLWVLGRQVEGAVHERAAPPIDWTTFSLFVAIDASPDRIFEAWGTSGGMESFFVEMMAIRTPEGRLLAPGEVAAPGCRYVWRWDSGALLAGDFLDVAPRREVGFTFGESKVRIRIHPQDTRTILELCQYDMEDTEQNRMHLHTNCRAAWVYFLTVLKTLLEHGIDGRDKSRATGASFSTYFDPARIGIHG